MAQKSVFEVYAHEYDLITNAKQREKPHSAEVKAIIERFKPTNVLDAGCATGLTAMLFAKHGVEAVGYDRSKPMLKVATEKFAKSKLPLSFVSGSFEKIPKRMYGKFDLIVCLANSISGVGTVANLKASLTGFRNALKPGGTLVLQMLNFEAVKEDIPNPIRITRNGKILYARYTIRSGKKLAIHINRIDLGPDPATQEPFYHEFEYFSPARVIDTVKKCRFDKIRNFGDLKFSTRFGKKSRDLVLTATVPS